MSTTKTKKEKLEVLKEVNVWVNKDLSISITPIFSTQAILDIHLIKDKACSYLQNSFDLFSDLDDNKYNFHLQDFKLWAKKINDNPKSRYTVNLDTYNNTYNLDNCLDQDIEYCHIESNDNEYIAIRKHLGGDIRGNYSNYEFFKLKEVDYNNFDNLFDGFLYNSHYENSMGLLNNAYTIPFKKLIDPNNSVDFWVEYNLDNYSSQNSYLNCCIDDNENLEIKTFDLEKMLENNIIDQDTYNLFEYEVNQEELAKLSIILFDHFYGVNFDNTDKNQLKLFNDNEYKILKDYEFMPLFVDSVSNDVYFNGYIVDKIEK